jgi:protocatechuate 3,4-dioxygenase beta subunit
MEGRLLLASGAGYLQGTVFVDSNLNGQYDPTETGQANATVSLYDSTHTLVATKSTGADGTYLFTSLAPGNYTLVETPPSTYANSAYQALSPLNVVSVGTSTASTVNVQVINPADLSTKAVIPGSNTGINFIDFSVNGVAQGNIPIYPIPVSITGPSPISVSQYDTYCVDIADRLNHGTNNFHTNAEPIPPASNFLQSANGERIAWLFHNYEVNGSTFTTTDANALQLAIWTLVYDTVPSTPTFATTDFQSGYLTFTGPGPFTTKAQYNAYLTAAANFINDSAGQSATATYLDAADDSRNSGGVGYQGMLLDGAINFGNTPKATPAVNTTAGATAGGVVGSAELSDSATISGGSNPTGTITFSLTGPDGSTSTIGSDNVNGNGTYASPTVPATAVGTYTWHAAYSGDGLNNGAIDNGANESVSITKASPTVGTQAAATNGGAVGSAILSDSATVSGGDNPTGTITFTLTNPDGSLSTVGTVSVNGDSTYASPSLTATEVGTYTWHASYGGNALNNSANDDGVNESVTTVEASPTVATQATMTGGAAVGSAVLSDSAIVSGGDNPGGNINFTLTQPDGTTITVGSVTVSGDGSYNSPTVLSSQVGTYTWHAEYNGDTLNNSAVDDGTNESVTTVQATSLLTTEASATAGGVVGIAVLSDSATLSGAVNPDGTLTFTLTEPDGSTVTVGSANVSGNGTYSSPTVLATQVGTYTWHASYGGDILNTGAIDNGLNESVTIVQASPTVATQAAASLGGVVGRSVLSDSATVSGGDNPTGTITFSLTAPDGTTNTVGTESVNGDGTYASPTVIATEVGTYTWHASYGGDPLNNGASDNGINESVTTIQASPSVATQAAATLGGVVGSSVLSDGATVSGGENPTGTITFTLTAPDGNTGIVGTVNVNGNGSYASPTVTATEVGTYTWHASYGGDAFNQGANDDGTNESVTIVQATPSITTQAGVTLGGVVGSSVLSDSATVSGGDDPTGTVTFTLTAPDGTTSTVGTASVNGDGIYNSPSVTATQVGTYDWHASYGGDTLNNGANDNGTNESAATVQASPTIATQATATGGGVVGIALLNDSATLSGGDSPTGTISFSLTLPDGSSVDEGTVNVNGDGVYSPPAAVTATAVGTYTWYAAYSGDTLDNAALDNGQNESVITVKASPSINTSASETAYGVVGSAVLSDSATLSGSYTGSGTIAFSLTAPDGTTSTVGSLAVNGDGTYASPTVTAAEVGTYTWHATYSGDLLNNGASDDGTNESLTTISTSSLTGEVYCDGDKTGSLTPGEPGVPGVTITLAGTTNTNQAVQATTTTDSSGNYSFTGLQPGAYTLTESNVPGSELASTATVGSLGGTSPANTVISSIPVAPGANGTNYNFGLQDLPIQGFLQGTAFVDTNGDGVLNAGDNVLAGATITLEDASGNPLATTTTDSNGNYFFGNLNPGNYQLVETLPAGSPDYNAGTQILSQLNPASGVNARTIQVTVANPNNIDATFDNVTASEIETVGLNNPPTAVTAYVGQYSLTLSGSAGTQTPYQTFCIDMTHEVSFGNTYPVLPSNLPASPGLPANAGEIGYLYNQFGLAALSSPTQAAGLQLAIWALEYNTTPNLTGGNLTVSGASAAAITAANQFLADAAGQSEPVAFINISDCASPSGRQGMLAPDSLNFANAPRSNPSINTTASASNGGVIGATVLSDQATLSGGLNPTGAITFTLTQPDGSTIAVGSVTVAGNGTYDSPSVTPTEVGNYTWHASYNGDGYNNGATDNGANEGVTTVKSSPAINTQATVSNGGVVGVAVLQDQATLTGGDSPTGSIAFTLTEPDGSTITVGSVTVTGDGAYSSLTVGATEVGSYTWHATYSGDSFNKGATDNGANEGVTTTKSSPAVSSQASETANGVVGAAVLSDSATVTGGDGPTGSITFTLTQPDGTRISVGTVTVTGDKSYASPTVTATQVGTYTWHASYGGDILNNSASDNGQHEQVTTIKASPAISTSASFKSGTGTVVGTAVPEDSAVVSGGYNETGNITFTLTAPNGTVVDTENVTIAGKGTYATSNATVATQIGTYAWTATYAGDAINNSAHDQGGAAEQLTTVSGISISGTKFLDLTGDGFSTDDTGLGSVTIDLLNSSNTIVQTATTATNGTYAFTGLAPGTYSVAEVVPSGYIQTGPTTSSPNVHMSNGAGVYTFTLGSGQSQSGVNFDDYQQECNLNNTTGVSFKVTTPSGCSTTVTNLRGNTQQGDTVTVTFTYKGTTNDELTLVSYTATGSSFDANTASQQAIYQTVTQAVVGDGKSHTYSITVQIPNCYYQIDFVCGPPIDHFGPAGSNVFYSAQGRLISADNGGTQACGADTISGVVYLDANDSGTFGSGDSGLNNVTLTLTGKDSHGNAVSLTTTTNSSGAYTFTNVPVSDSTGYTITETPPTGYLIGKDTAGSLGGAAGTYQIGSIVVGNTNLAGTSYNFGHVLPGSISGSVYIDTNDNGSRDSGETGLGGVTVSLNGTDDQGHAISLTTTTATSGTVGAFSFAGLRPGTYTVSYTEPSGYFHTGNQVGTVGGVANGVLDNVLDDFIRNIALPSGGAGINYNFGELQNSKAPCVGHGATATIGFWHNCNGQALIDSFNGCSTSTKLGNWLANTLPDLYGAGSTALKNLTNATNAQVASFFLTLFNEKGQTTDAQVLATALAVYATNSTLAGGTMASQYGFLVTANGTGADAYNVGSSGAAIGLGNNAAYTVLTLLQQADLDKKNGTYGTSAFNALNTIFSAINQTGDING